MIPSVLATQVRSGLEDYLRATFPVETPFFRGLLDRFFAERDRLFRGPYLSLKLPFRLGTGLTGTLYPELPMTYLPYLHQERAYERLSAERPLSTLVATGTGSGKTECFMYPLLHHCWLHRAERGIKAIVIYPMNALATDQMRRFAQEIFRNPELKGNVTVGLFIGGQQSDAEGSQTMQEETVITCRNTMLRHPPDILMTNYKMLDYLLLRPKDYPLWSRNAPDTLRYIVVDELHTFDGAQGTDLACLLRRLLHRLDTTPERICFAGTSATLGGDDASVDKLLAFATKVFGTAFDRAAVIAEDVLHPYEFLGDTLSRPYPVPTPEDLHALLAARRHLADDYLQAQLRLWFGPDGDLGDLSQDDTRVALGNRLREHHFFQNLIKLLGNGNAQEEDLTAKLERLLPGFAKRPRPFREAFFDSIYALISLARREITRQDGRTVVVPFLNVRVQLWMREMRRMVATVEQQPTLHFAADLDKDAPVRSLPIFHCRECGTMGYLAIRNPASNTLLGGLDDIYAAYFSGKTTVCLIHPLSPDETDTSAALLPQLLCGHCLHLNDGGQACAACGKSDRLLRVQVESPHVQARSGAIYLDKHCRRCGSTGELAILGARSASLTSVVISLLFASPYNDSHPKLLAFSDSVQDASHRAGFFTARTYRFHLRTAIQQLVRTTADNPLSLPQLAERFLSEWETRLGSPEALIAQFIPADLIDHDYDTLAETGKLPKGSRLPELVRQRLRWEIWSEYGFHANLGRTLVKTRCSIAALRPQLLDRWADSLLAHLHNHLNLRQLTPLHARRLLAALVRELCDLGAIADDCLQHYMADGNIYELHKQHPFIPNYFRKRTPVFVTLAHSHEPFCRLLDHRHIRLLNRVLERQGGFEPECWQAVLDLGVELGALRQATANKGLRTWGLNPDHLLVTPHVETFACDAICLQLAVPAWEHDLWQDMPCWQTDDDHHDARLTHVPNADDDGYYAQLFNYGHVQRSVAREHTGLLNRDDREQLERLFIHGDSLAAPNILSCTPTLEMGINIGDLSSVILCSVPPAQANYVQRIGRAGRVDGNAFNFVVAAGNRHHDLHFFAEPQEMMSGAIVPPGIFLEAPAVLERQLTAFCFDSWCKDARGTQNIPTQLRAVLAAVARQDLQRFPFTLFAYVAEHRDDLLAHFLGLFPQSQHDMKAPLAHFLDNTRDGGLAGRTLCRLQLLAQQRATYQRKLQDVTRRLHNAQAKPPEARVKEEIRDLTQEKQTLNATLDDIDKKQTFNFFTDEGLLPNYAFPEAGVTLRSIIYCNHNGKGAARPPLTEEYDRPGRAAISEFAPGNTFYVNGRKLTISRIILADSDIERWHFCGVCNHIERVTDDPHTASCPNCGSPTWGDGNMLRNVVRMREVVASGNDLETRSFDEGDDRTPAFFNKFMMAEFRPQNIDCAYKCSDPDVPFGFEFLHQADFREINFGPYTGHDADDLSIARHKVSRQGFQVCRDCGVVALDNRPFRHRASCRYHGGANDAAAALDCLYLFREFQSEAIRILLPIDEMELDTKMNSFIAALYMGLRERFEGSVDHIQIMRHQEPIPDSSQTKTYLVLFDQIPGGTGYLKQLTRSADEFMRLLQQTLARLQNCRCQHEPSQDDGCYSCLFAYRVSHDLPNIRSSDARSVLECLLAHRDAIVTTSTIGDINVNPILESALEKLFIERLATAHWQSQPLELERRLLAGKLGYVLKVGTLAYTIEPQVHLGHEHGVALDSKPDFLITPLHRDQNPARPIAVFTDGFHFHANLQSPDAYRLPDDLAKRMAIAKSGRYRVWSLTYDDVAENPEHPSDFPRILVSDRKWQPFFQLDAFEQLLHLLANPEEPYGRMALKLVGSGNGIARLRLAPQTCADLRQRLLEAPQSPPLPDSQPHGTAICLTQTIRNEASAFSLNVLLAPELVASKAYHQATVVLRLADDLPAAPAPDAFRPLWHAFLWTANLLQFLPHAVTLSDRFVQNGLPIPAPAPDTPARPAEDKEWRELIESLADDPTRHALALRLMTLNLPVPTCDLELETDDGEATGDLADFAWPDRHLAVVASDEARLAFSQRQWDTLPLDDPNLCQRLADKLEHVRP
ncbi:MAG: DEAD/DEAH box helicase [Oligosphaeraceae bacterium]